ncbi:uncharacterized protein BO72DRAFT_525766 [Aspergillus fijiensis CBS 313.89]|uniref:Uncharacterized protein n=1 Tax=Aspergillus fijiensis CBS 313.89 TaxID=1448319 RepID=A0A8G1W073_9EURO|nr:uncharacterized protein BO72DRAFT_525766 [Aspergillus fijiensis CBS 313.89]RAK79575.1 hypothetical protein BO72DRAFT_525766 [Aspergillus fijiensis CBS 313.89]
MDNYHACSSVISEFEARKAGAFTSLPIRVNRYSEVATKAAQDFVCKWNCHFDVGSNYPGSTSATRFGPRDSPLVMIIPEAQPDRLATAACLAEMARLLDDLCHRFGTHNRHEGFELLNRCIEQFSASSSCSCSGSCGKSLGGDRQHHYRHHHHHHHHHRLQQVISEIFSDVCRAECEHGVHLLEVYRKAIVRAPTPLDCKKKFAFEAFWPILEFAIGVHLSHVDHMLLHEIKDVADECLALNDEYWSWTAGCADHKAGRNIIDCFVRVEGLSVDAAREKVRRSILELESRFLSLKDRFSWQHPTESIRLHRWIEAVGAAMASYNYWRANLSSPCFSSSNCGKAEWTSTSSTTTLIDRPCSPQLSYRLHHSSLESKTTDTTALTAPTTYISSIASTPTTAILNMLPAALNCWARAPEPSLQHIQTIFTNLHNATLILWDIFTASTTRHSSPATHVVFGTAQATNSAYYAFTHALQSVQHHPHLLSNPPQATAILTEGLTRLFTGQSWALNWKFTHHIPTEPEYLGLIDDTTGALFSILVRLLQSQSRCAPPSPSPCHPHNSSSSTNDPKFLNRSDSLLYLTNLLARFIRIREEYLFFTTESTTPTSTIPSKPGAESTIGGYSYSYPIIRLLNTRPEYRAQITALLSSSAAAATTGSCSSSYAGSFSGCASRGTSPSPCACPPSTASSSSSSCSCPSSTGANGTGQGFGVCGSAIPPPMSVPGLLHLLRDSGVLAATREFLRDMEEQIEREVGRLEAGVFGGETNSLVRTVVGRLSVRGVV